MLPSADDLTPEEVAARTRQKLPTVHAALRRGELRGYKVGRSWRIPPQALDAYCREPPQPRPVGPRRRYRARADQAAAEQSRIEERLRERGLLV